LAVLAYLFVTVVYLRAKKNFWCDVGTDTEEDAAVVAALDLGFCHCCGRKFDDVFVDST
jgi:hypothetical protein